MGKVVKGNKNPDLRSKSKGRPSGKGLTKAALKNAGVEHLDVDEETADKYTTGSDEAPGENIHIRHPNRNLNKPDIDKPPYS